MTPPTLFTNHSQVTDFNTPSGSLDYIDLQVSSNLDSSQAFEGPEKLLELWFSPSSSTLPSNWPTQGLRSIPLCEIEKLLKIVNCEILSKISSNSSLDAYLLSESSLFIYSNKFILKTCGTTTTLLCLDQLKYLINKYIDNSFTSYNDIYRIFYSHRSFLFPERQNPIHQNWDNELDHLNKYFPVKTSKTYILNDQLKFNENWHLYVNGNENVRNSTTPASNDITIEILMSDLNVENSKNFQLSTTVPISNIDSKNENFNHLLGDYMMEKTNLNKIIKHNNVKHDSFAFEPCGYSSNSIINKNNNNNDNIQDNYYTIHITPEVGWSYASFETNYVPQSNEEMLQIFNNVIKSINPGRFTVVVCYEEDCNFDSTLPTKLDVYTLNTSTTIQTEFGYHLVHGVYTK